MKVEKLGLNGFRNIEELYLYPEAGINIISGNNAQGKTSILEGIWLFTGKKSFRRAKDAEIIKKDEDFCRAQLSFFGEGRSQNAQITLAPKKEIKLNDIKQTSQSSLCGSFAAVVFSPAHLSLVSSGPAERRLFIDDAICQLRPGFSKLIKNYSRCLWQRGRLLSEAAVNPSLLSTLDIWDEYTAHYGALIMSNRERYVERLKTAAKDNHLGISSETEELKVYYSSQIGEIDNNNTDSIKNALLSELINSREQDIREGSTSKGPHRDDLVCLINDMDVRQYGSQGQQRSAVISLKLAEAQLIREVYGEDPVILLDDVLSDLDKGRRAFLLSKLSDKQVFITCCDRETVELSPDCGNFYIEGGKLV